ncbi:MFS transporter [Streptomyces olivochromogenes]|uniref:MFS transporter n=1 Tax=Streptomyces olivochromogenes TaxID=1963 RepID=A0A250VL13_STROL|nr:MFS transporter [Streptomyces olivochromogenes]KUN44111.1 MFS transporter [Streptomyces olivochromogenes]GAX54903.1 MFS transporter [Streptomyces olivochromogenes]
MPDAPTSHKKIPSASAPGGPPSGRVRRGLSRPVAFASIAAVFVLFMAASSAPSPLYVIYQHQWSFSATTLTTVFAVYVVGMIGALLVLGALSDHIGRRPVLASAIALEAVAMALFIVADDVSILLTARFVQGIATGAAMTTLGATLVDLNPPHAPHRAGVISGAAPPFGLGLGALGCGVLAEYGPHPTRLVYVLLLASLVLAGLLVALIPETAQRRPGVVRSLQPRLGVAPRLRADLMALVPILLASWALGGLYLSLGPSVAANLFGLSSHVVGGLVVTLLCVPASITAFALRGWPTERTLALAATLLLLGTAVGLGGVEAHSLTMAASGTAIAGVGFGGSALASFGTLARIAEPAERGELFAVAFVISYLAFSIPAVVAGIAATNVGLHETSVVYSAAVIAFSALALAAQRLRTGRDRNTGQGGRPATAHR